MSKLLKVTLEFDDKTMIAEGEEAEKWVAHCYTLTNLARVHNTNPFDIDPINWTVIKKEKG